MKNFDDEIFYIIFYLLYNFFLLDFRGKEKKVRNQIRLIKWRGWKFWKEN